MCDEKLQKIRQDGFPKANQLGSVSLGAVGSQIVWNTIHVVEQTQVHLHVSGQGWTEVTGIEETFWARVGSCDLHMISQITTVKNFSSLMQAVLGD